MKAHIGGLWNFSSKTPEEFQNSHGYTAESIYEDMDCLTPFQTMLLNGFYREPKNPNGHFTSKEFEVYLNDYVAHFDLNPHIVLNAIVKKTEKVGQIWSVTVSINGVEETRQFDHIVMSVGHNSKPKSLNSEQFPGIENFKGKV